LLLIYIIIIIIIVIVINQFVSVLCNSESCVATIVPALLQKTSQILVMILQLVT
jgi:hypothetical protein